MATTMFTPPAFLTMPGQQERWSRGCGSGGVDYSGGKVPFDPQCLVGNWVEDRADVFPGTTVVGSGMPFLPHTTQRTSYHPYGKSGAELVDNMREPANVPNRSHDVLTRHGSFDEPPVQCLATTYSLVHGEKRLGEPRTQSYLWQGYKRNDLFTPHSTTMLSRTSSKQQQWHDVHTADPYATTTRNTQLPTALAASEAPPRTPTKLQPWTSRSMPGRRPLGMFVEEVDKNYRKTGLRSNWGW